MLRIPVHGDAQVTVTAAEAAPADGAGIPIHVESDVAILFDSVNDVTAATAVVYRSLTTDGALEPYTTITLPIDGSVYDLKLESVPWKQVAAKVTALAGGGTETVRRTIMLRPIAS